MKRVKDCDELDIIIELEGGELLIEDVEDFKTIKNIASSLRFSQGFYSRLYNDIKEVDPEIFPYPFIM